MVASVIRSIYSDERNAMSMSDEISKRLQEGMNEARGEAIEAEEEWSDEVRRFVEKAASDVVEILTDKSGERPWQERMTDARARLTLVLSELSGQSIPDMLEIEREAVIIVGHLQSYAAFMDNEHGDMN
jgi:hypothetical protein